MEITIHNVPEPLHQALIARAAAEHKSVDQFTVDALAKCVGVEIVSPDRPVKPRDLSDIAGTWEEDPEFDAIIEEQSRVDPELWK